MATNAKFIAELLDANGDVLLANLDNVSSDLSGLTDVTVNASDPTYTSNKTPVGHFWINSTTPFAVAKSVWSLPIPTFSPA